MVIDEQKLNDWIEAKERLDIAKKTELSCRFKVCEQMFGKREGEFKVKDESPVNKRIVTAESKVNRNVDWESLGFDKEEFMTEVRELLGDYMPELSPLELGLIDSKISLNISRYKKAEEEAENINEAMTITPATPSLSVKFKD